LWFVLFATSIPIHMLYNSVIYSSTAMTDCAAFLVTPDFVTGGPWNQTVLELADGHTPPARLGNNTNIDLYGIISNVQIKAINNSLQKLSDYDCYQGFVGSQDFPYHWSDVLVVTNLTRTNSFIMGFVNPAASLDYSNWICNATQNNYTCDDLVQPGGIWQVPDVPNCSPDELVVEPCYDTSTPKVAYCLAEPFTAQCKLNASPLLLLVVIVFNIIKLSCLLWISSWSNFDPLVTTGDAISSFLKDPDCTIERLGPISITQVCKSRKMGILYGGIWKEGHS